MKVLGDLNLENIGSLVQASVGLESGDTFPPDVDTIVGRLAFVNKKLYIAADIQVGVPVWVELTDELNAFVFTKPVAATTWTIVHDLNAQTPVVQAYDSSGVQLIPDAITIVDANTVTVSFNVAQSGRAIVVSNSGGTVGGGGAVSSVSGTTNRITASPTTGDVILDISSSYVGQSSITTLGTVATGTWNATTIALTKGGTGATTQAGAANAVLPTQTGNSGEFLTTDGTNVSWATVNSLPTQTGNSGKFLTTNGTVASWATVSTGTVTSITVQSSGAAANAITVSGSPITTSGTISIQANVFTTSAPGVVPASGGGTTNFLRADGNWAAASGGGGTPAGSNTQVQFNNSGAFGADAAFTFVSGTQTLSIGTTAVPAVITGAQGAATAAGTAVTLQAGAGGSTSGAGGTLTLKSGAGTATGAGGAVAITAGNGGATGNGGDLNISAGNGGSTSGTAGNVNINGGTAVSGGGSIVLSTGGATRLAIDSTGAAVLTAADASTCLTINVPTATTGTTMIFAHGGVGRGFIGTGTTSFTGGNLADFGMSSGLTASGGLIRFGINRGATTAMQIAQTGNVTINTPASGNSAFTVTGVSGTAAVSVTNTSSIAINIVAGAVQVGGSAGTSGQLLTSGGANTTPSWTTVAGAALTSTQIGYGSASNVLTGTVDFKWTEATNPTLTMGSTSGSGTTATVTTTQGTSAGSCNLTLSTGAGQGTGTTGNITIQPGGGFLTASGPFSGGSLTLQGGTAGSTIGNGGAGSVTVQGGTGSSAAGSSGSVTGGPGSTVTIQGGTGGVNGQSGGVAGTGGSLTIAGGLAATPQTGGTAGTGGSILFKTATSNSLTTHLTISNTGVFTWNGGTTYTASQGVWAITPTTGNPAFVITASGASVAALNIQTGLLQLAGSAGTSGQVLTSQGATTTPIWAAVSASTATNISGGGTAQIPFQSAASTTAFDTAFTWTTGTQTLSIGTTAVPAIITGAQGASSAAGTAVTLQAGAGGSSSGAGGALTLKGGVGTANGAGGAVTITAGSGGAATFVGGAVTITSGAGVGTGNGGAVSMTAANTTGSGTGGAVTISSGTGGSTGAGGSITIQAGAGGSTSGLGGTLTLMGSSATAGSTPGNVDIRTQTTSTAAGVVTFTDTSGQPFISLTRSPTNSSFTTAFIQGGLASDGSTPLALLMQPRQSGLVNGIGATLTLQGGQANGAGTGGVVNINGGTPAAATGTAGAVNINGGAGLSTSNAGAVNINGGAAPSSGHGGNVVITGGASSSFTAGDVNLVGGTGTTNGNLNFTTGGTLRLQIGSGGNWFIGSSSGTSNQVLTSTGAGTAPTWQTPISPINTQAGSYTLVIGDGNGTVYSTNTGAQTITIPANTAVAFPVGTRITIINDGTTAVTVAITTDTMVLGGSGGTGSRTLGVNGVATLIKVTTTKWYITGFGVT